MYKYLLIIEKELAERIKAKAEKDRRTIVATIKILLETALEQEKG